MEYFRCNVAQSLPGLSFGLFIYKREINSGNLNLDLAHIGTQLFDFGNSCLPLEAMKSSRSSNRALN